MKKRVYAFIILFVHLTAFIVTTVLFTLTMVNILDWLLWIVIVLFIFGLQQLIFGIIIFILIWRIINKKGDLEKQKKILKKCSYVSLNRLALQQINRWDDDENNY